MVGRQAGRTLRKRKGAVGKRGRYRWHRWPPVAFPRAQASSAEQWSGAHALPHGCETVNAISKVHLPSLPQTSRREAGMADLMGGGQDSKAATQGARRARSSATCMREGACYMGEEAPREVVRGLGFTAAITVLNVTAQPAWRRCAAARRRRRGAARGWATGRPPPAPAGGAGGGE